MALPGPEGAPPVVETPKKKPEEVMEGGLKREHFKAAGVVEAIDNLPKDEVWSLVNLGPATLAMTQCLELSRAIYGLDRSADFYAKDAVDGLLAKMDIGIASWQDGHAGEKASILTTAEERKAELKQNLRNGLAKKEWLGFERVALTKGSEVSDDDADNGDGMVVGEFQFKANEDVITDWIQDKVNCDTEIDETKTALRAAEADPKMQEAQDFFTLIGCTPEQAEALLKNEELVESRELLSFWLRRQSTGFDALVSYYGQVVKATADLDTAGELLTRSWNDKPGNTEMFATLVTPEMDAGVTEIFRTLMAIDIIPSSRVVTTSVSEVGIQNVGDNQFKDCSVVVQRNQFLADPALEKYAKYGLVEPVYKKKADGSWDVDADGNKRVEKYLAARSIFSGDQTPEQRRLWLRGMEKLVTDRLRAKGVKDASAWSKQSLPVALAWYEILLLAPRSGVRRDEKGHPYKEPLMVKNGNGESRVAVDWDGKPMYVTEKAGPSTMSGWLNDTEEKLDRTKDRLTKEGAAGHSAPPMLAAFAAPERYMWARMEAWEAKDSNGNKIKTVGPDGKEKTLSLFEAVRQGKQSMGEVLKSMTEGSRAVEALLLFRSVQMFNGLTPPLANIEIVTTLEKYDPKHMEAVAKYFTTLTKASRALNGDDFWRVTLDQVNAVAQIIRYAEKTIPTEGGNALNTTKIMSLDGIKVLTGDARFDAIAKQLTVSTQEMTREAYDLAVRLGKKGDGVALLLPSDVEGEPTLKKLLSRDPKNNPTQPYRGVATHGLVGKTFTEGTTERANAVKSLLLK